MASTTLSCSEELDQLLCLPGTGQPFAMSTLTNSKNGKREGSERFVYLNLFLLASSKFLLTAQSLNPLVYLLILQKKKSTCESQ